MKRILISAALVMLATPAFAGPPYVTDDAEPTDLGHYEIYLFSQGTSTRDDADGEASIDFNYGAAPDLQLTAVLPLAWSAPQVGPSEMSLGNIELAAKYKILHQDDIGVDVAVFPRVFLPAGSPAVGERHTSLLLPVWIEHDWEKWTTFGGGGCELNRGGDSQNFCIMGWALTRQVTEHFQLGAEIFHQTADSKGARASTGLGFGAIYDLNENLHLMASAGPGLQNAAETGNANWYAALLVTF